MMNEALTGRTLYWDDYYAGAVDDRIPLPSQFAVFVAGELDRAHQIVEFGCGTGRDAIFLASRGHQVVGVDASAQAIKTSEARARAAAVDVSFLAGRVDDTAWAGRLPHPDMPRVIYARFFVHAITDAEEEAFLDVAASLSRPGDRLAVEYRTIRDASGARVTQQHYRRYVSPATFQARAATRGFGVEYAVEGFGFAKYQQDDAYVARTLLVRQ
jgi:SAM-dependent methyltransferase